MTRTTDKKTHTSSQTKPISKSSDSENRYIYARDLISHQRLITIDVNETLDKALKMMLQFDIRHLPVVDISKENEPLVGVISERDMRLVAASPVLDPDIHLPEMIQILSKHKVREAMQTSLYTISDDDNILAACKIMRLSKRGALPVTEKDSNKLVGVITQTDLLDHLIRVLEPLEPEAPTTERKTGNA